MALGINASGRVVGTRGRSLTRALLYTDAAGLQELNALIDPSLGWVLLGALVVGTWTQPDGSTHDDYAWTDANGLAILTTRASQGSYTVTIVNIVLSLHTFDPSHSVLVKSITVPR